MHSTRILVCVLVGTWFGVGLVAGAAPAAELSGSGQPRATAGDSGDGKDPATAEGILEVIRDQQDKTPRRLIEALGKLKSVEAIDALEESVELMRGRWQKQYVFVAMRHSLKDAALAARVVEFTRAAGLKEQPAVARAAAGAMAKWGAVAQDALFEIAEDGWDDEARALAIRGLHGVLSSRADDASLRIILEGYVIPKSGSLDQAVGLLRGFRSREQLETMARFVRDFIRDGDAPAGRVFALLDALGGHPAREDERLDEGIDRVFGVALGSKDTALQYRALRAIALRGVCKHEKRLKRLVKSKDATVRRAATLAGIRIEAMRDDRILGGWRLDPFKLARSKDPVTRQAAALGLGQAGGAQALEVLHGLTKDEEIAVRAEAVQALLQLRDRSSIPVLIDGLESAEGRMRLDFKVALVRLTGMDIGLNPATWRTFWSKEQDTFEVPTAKASAKAAEERAKRRKKNGSSSAAFYGIDVLSEAFALAVDTSGSMKAKVGEGKSRLDVAKEQITRTLSRVPDGVLFNVIPFSGSSAPFSEELIPLTEDARQEAVEFVEELEENGGTNIYDALSAAFEDERIDTVYLLSDGSPSAGDLVDLTELRAEIERWNSVRGIVIHAIAVGQDHPLLRGLAEDSGGVYVRVD